MGQSNVAIAKTLTGDRMLERLGNEELRDRKQVEIASPKHLRREQLKEFVGAQSEPRVPEGATFFLREGHSVVRAVWSLAEYAGVESVAGEDGSMRKVGLDVTDILKQMLKASGDDRIEASKHAFGSAGDDKHVLEVWCLKDHPGVLSLINEDGTQKIVGL